MIRFWQSVSYHDNKDHSVSMDFVLYKINSRLVSHWWRIFRQFISELKRIICVVKSNCISNDLRWNKHKIIYFKLYIGHLWRWHLWVFYCNNLWSFITSSYYSKQHKKNSYCLRIKLFLFQSSKEKQSKIFVTRIN